MKEPMNNRIRRLRKAKGFSGAEMARKIGVAPSTYREWEKGRGMNTPPLLEISQALSISVTELVTGESSPASGLAEELEKMEEKLREIRLKMISLG